MHEVVKYFGSGEILWQMAMEIKASKQKLPTCIECKEGLWMSGNERLY